MKTYEPSEAEKKVIEQSLIEAAKEIEWGGQRPARFLAAWKRGIKLAGEEYFNVIGDIDSATNKNQLEPNYKFIDHAIRALSSGQGAFLAAMYVFFDSQGGKKLMEKIDCPTMYDISMCLDKQRLEIIAELFVNNCGW